MFSIFEGGNEYVSRDAIPLPSAILSRCWNSQEVFFIQSYNHGGCGFSNGPQSNKYQVWNKITANSTLIMRCSQLFISYALGGLKGQCHEKITTVEHMGCLF